MTSPQTLAPPTKPGSPGNGGPIERSRPECLLRPAAELLQVEPATVAELAEKGELPGRRVGDDWRFARSALLEWLAGTGR